MGFHHPRGHHGISDYSRGEYREELRKWDAPGESQIGQGMKGNYGLDGLDGLDGHYGHYGPDGHYGHCGCSATAACGEPASERGGWDG